MVHSCAQQGHPMDQLYMFTPRPCSHAGISYSKRVRLGTPMPLTARIRDAIPGLDKTLDQLLLSRFNAVEKAGMPPRKQVRQKRIRSSSDVNVPIEASRYRDLAIVLFYT